MEIVISLGRIIKIGAYKEMLGLKISLIVFISCLVLAIVFLSINFGISLHRYYLYKKRLKILTNKVDVRDEKTNMWRKIK